MLLTLLILIALFLLSYFYLKLRYFSKQFVNIPGYEPEFLFGNLRQSGVLQGEYSFWQALCNLQEKFGDIFQYAIGLNSRLVFCRPHQAEYILSTQRQTYETITELKNVLTLFMPKALIMQCGFDHKRLNRIMLPLLRKYRILPYMHNILDRTDELLRDWKKKYGGDRNTGKINFQIFEDYSSLTLEIIGLIAFDYDFNIIGKDDRKVKNDQNMTLGEATSNIIQIMSEISLSPLPIFLARIYLYFFCPKYQKSLSLVHGYVSQIIANYKGKQQRIDEESNDELKPAIRQNLIAQLVSNLQEDEEKEEKKLPSERQGITKQELLDNIFLLMFAGYETSATVLSWFTYFVSKCPDVQQRMKQEIRQHCGIDELTVENLQKLEYCDCVLKETLRLAPTIVGVAREPTVQENNTNLDGVKLDKGQSLMVSIACLHSDKRNWKMNPLQFLPERFYGSEAPDINHHPYAFLPFGSGRHQCAGQELARFELKLIMVRLMQYVTFEDTPGNTGGHAQRMTIAPKNLAVYVRFDDEQL
ncbi:unnamed protein product [Rotaria sp. Silwood1]|nr:unnamed protein product [Rotaria sp. Silwood1]CAF4951951.1 unnamed protein product [Rotaria sp. Silwood1]